jgi:hypothetical protein
MAHPLVYMLLPDDYSGHLAFSVFQCTMITVILQCQRVKAANRLLYITLDKHLTLMYICVALTQYSA